MTVDKMDEKSCGNSLRTEKELAPSHTGTSSKIGSGRSSSAENEI
jgi:hypothetical protein